MAFFGVVVGEQFQSQAAFAVEVPIAHLVRIGGQMRPFGKQFFDAGSAIGAHQGRAQRQSRTGAVVIGQTGGHPGKVARLDAADPARIALLAWLNAAGVNAQGHIGRPRPIFPLLVCEQSTGVFLGRRREVKPGRGIIAVLVPQTNRAVGKRPHAIQVGQRTGVVREHTELHPQVATRFKFAVLIARKRVVQF